MPSTDIASAWLVVEKMRERGFYFSLSCQSPETRWLAVFANDARVGDAEEITAPLSICRAALETTTLFVARVDAVGGEK